VIQVRAVSLSQRRLFENMYEVSVIRFLVHQARLLATDLFDYFIYAFFIYVIFFDYVYYV
jgi:hypothetical protein